MIHLDLRASALEILDDLKEMADWYWYRYRLWQLGRRADRIRAEIDKAWAELPKEIREKP